MHASDESLGYYISHYARYIIPTWLFPVYFVAFGLVCEHFRIHFGGLLFWLLVIPAFFATFLWSRVPRIPRSRRWFLTMLIPFLIFVSIAVLLAIVAFATGVRNL